MTDSRLLTTASSIHPQDQKQIVKFGGLPMPGLGGTSPWIDLNDEVSWFISDYQPDGVHIALSAQQMTWHSGGVWTGQDFSGGRIITLVALFDESGGVPLSRALASLAMAGEQMLTFDNVTGIRCKYSGFSNHTIVGPSPYIRSLTITFTTRDPFSEDLAGLTTTDTISFNSDTAGTVAHNIAVTYDGSVFTRPTLHLYVAGTVGTVRFNNVNEGALVSTPAIGGPSNTTFDSDALRIITQGVTDLPPGGTFPLMYTGSQTFSVFVKAASTTACSAYLTYLRRFEIH